MMRVRSTPRDLLAAGVLAACGMFTAAVVFALAMIDREQSLYDQSQILFGFALTPLCVVLAWRLARFSAPRVRRGAAVLFSDIRKWHRANRSRKIEQARFQAKLREFSELESLVQRIGCECHKCGEQFLFSRTIPEAPRSKFFALGSWQFVVGAAAVNAVANARAQRRALNDPFSVTCPKCGWLFMVRPPQQ